MAEPMKIRATHQGEFTEVKVLLIQDGEPGQGRRRPCHRSAGDFVSPRDRGGGTH